jgi:sugar phosphate isomerase/epimerase
MGIMDDRITREEAKALTDEIVALCKKRGLWIAHEDNQGGFIFQRTSTEEWLIEATDNPFRKFPRAADWYGEIKE